MQFFYKKVTGETETFAEDPSWLPYVFAPPFWVLFALALIVPRFISPWLGRTLIPDSYSKLKQNRGIINSLLPSTIHAVFVSLMTLYILATGSMGENRIFSKSRLGFVVMQSCLGYFTADFLCCLIDTEMRKDKAMLFHHAVSIIGIFIGLYTQGKFMFFVVYRFVTESSTPFVNLFWLMRELKKQKSAFFVFNSVLMVILFFICRVAPIPWHWWVFYWTVKNPDVILLSRTIRMWTFLTYLMYDVLNIIWFWKMFKGGVKYFVKSDKSVVE